MRGKLRKIARQAVSLANAALAPAGYRMVPSRALLDYHLHPYDSYEQYRQIQIEHNIRKINNVWADAQTMDRVAALVRARVGDGPVKGICHGTRNGFEQNYLNDTHAGFDVIGTDISDTATDYPNSVVWDFHDTNPDWAGQFDFVYSNSLDQGWKPQMALTAWLNQLRPGGVVILELTIDHGPEGASEMDPFGVRPTALPYVLAEWYGHQVSVSVTKGKKGNMDKDVWLFAIARTVDHVEPLV